jgi:hypothetical protein
MINENQMHSLIRNIIYESAKKRQLIETANSVFGGKIITSQAELEQILSQTQPVKGWFVSIAYIEQVKMLLTNKNKPEDNYALGKSMVGNQRVQDYLNSPNYDPSSFKMKNPYANSIITIKKMTFQWDVNGYENKMNMRNNVIDRYFGNERRYNNFLRALRDGRQGEIGMYMKQLDKYLVDNDVPDNIRMKLQSNPDPDEIRKILKYVAKKDRTSGLGWDKSDYTAISQYTNGNTALRLYSPHKRGIKEHSSYEYYLVEYGMLKPLDQETEKFFSREFRSKPTANYPKIGIEGVIDFIVNSRYDFKNYSMPNIVFLSMTPVDQNGVKQKINYVNADLQVPGHPEIDCQDIINQFKKNQIGEAKISKAINESLNRLIRYEK